MTLPDSYIPKTPGTVEAMYTGMFSENIQDVIDWVTSLVPVDAVVSTNGMGSGWVENGSFTMAFGSDQYVYVDEDGLHCVDKGSFEMVYKKDE
jgi:hypothetical protein